MSFLPTFSGNLETLTVSVTFAYLIGSIPSGIIWAKFFKLGSLKNIGSGNIGATNVLRTGNKIAAFLTLICDAGKGSSDFSRNDFNSKRPFSRFLNPRFFVNTILNSDL